MKNKKKITLKIKIEKELWDLIKSTDLFRLFKKSETEKDVYELIEFLSTTTPMVKEAQAHYGTIHSLAHSILGQRKLVEVYVTNGLEIIPEDRTVSDGVKTIILKKQSMHMLEQLIMDSHIVHSREKLRVGLSEKGSFLDDNALNACICRLRRELDQITSEELIKTYSTLGYKWEPEVKKIFR